MGSFPFARRYLENRCFFLFLGLLRCFSSPRFLLACYIFTYGYLHITVGEFPHSEICGLSVICTCSQLIAAYHVLLRLPVPRHSPYALLRLTYRLPDVASSGLLPLLIYSMKIFLVFSVEIIVIYLTNSLSLSFSSKLLIFSRFRFLFFCVKDLFLHILFSSQGTESVSMLAYTLQRTDILEKNLYIKDSLSLWWRIQGSNLRPPACKAGALPAELIPHKTHSTEFSKSLERR